MDRQSHDLIMALLTEEWNYLQTEIKYLEHQRTLPHEHRKIENEDAEVGRTIHSLHQTSTRVQAAINGMRKVKIES